MRVKSYLWLTTFLVAGSVFAVEPENMEVARQAVIHYHDSGAYEKALANVGQNAQHYLATRLNEEKHFATQKRLALVFDIDDTALSNYAELLQMRFGGTVEEFDDAIAKGQDPAITPTLALFNYAKEHHLAVFFVTGRREPARQLTIDNLVKAGYQHWDGLYLKPTAYHEPTVANYKIAAREQIEKLGYTIVLNIGDQDSDLVGGHADKTFKLPNPYYFIP